MKLRSLSRLAALVLLTPILTAAGSGSAATRGALTRTDGTVDVTQSGIWGGGFMNVIARDPSKASHRYVIGGDTAGLLVSNDDGTSWTAANAGLQDISQTTIAAAAFQRPPHDNEVYAAYGTAFASNSGLLHSSDGGSTWTPVAATGSVLPIFSGGHSTGYPAYQVGSGPRATGGLLVLAEKGGQVRHIYAGTFGDGVMRSDDGGLTWTRIALGSDATNPHCTFTTNSGTAHGCFVTGLIKSGIARERNTLYVAVHGGDASTCIGDGVCGGVFKLANAMCSGDGCADPTTTRITGTPVDPVNAEELAMVRGTLLCACGTDGFYVKNPADEFLTQHNANLAFDPSIQTSYVAVAGGPGMIFLGAFNPACENVPRETCHSVYESTDGAASWVDLAFNLPLGNVDTTVYGTSVEWWETSQKANLIDGRLYTAASMVVTGDATPRLLVAGRSGVWTTTDADQMHWQPTVQGIGAISGLDIVADVHHPGHVYVGAKDWETFNSASYLDPGTVVQSETPKSEHPSLIGGFAVAVDQQDPASPSAVYLGAGIPGFGQGEVDHGGVYLNADPTLLPWVNQNLVTDGSCGTRLTPRVIAVGVTHPTEGSPPVVYAATDGCGLYQLADGAWTRLGANTDMFAQEDFLFNYGQIAIPNGLGRVIYALDRKTGELWRSESGGANWGGAPIYTIPQGERSYNDGFIGVDPNVQGTSVVWLSTGAPAGLHTLTCLDHCQSAGSWTDTLVTEVPNPGPIAILPCTSPCTSTVYVGTRAVEGDTTVAALYKTTPSGTFCDATASTPLYAGAGGFPAQLTLGTDALGTVMGYLITSGSGAIVIKDGSGASCEVG